jgi:hypothetical protein
MYPAKPPREFPSPAEEQFYYLVEKQLPDDFIVMHGVPWLDPHSYRYHLEGETDFVVVHKDLGIIVLEVKGGRIRIDGGQWYSIDGNDRVHHLNRSPMDQARDSMRVLLDKLKRSPSTKRFQRQYNFHTGVIFPNVTAGPNGLGPHVPRKVIIDKTDLHSIEMALRRIVSDKSPDVKLTDVAIEAFVDLVRPNEVLDNMGYGDVILDSGERIEAYTEGQYEVLNLLRNQHRIAIPGCAGSGKTMLAIRKTRFLAQSGLRVLLTCYNKPLGTWLQEQIYRDPQIPKGTVRVANFHLLADELFGESRITPPRRRPGGDLFSVDIPEHLVDNAGTIQDKFDAIVVDEGQDFSPAMWAALQALMIAPDSGIFYVFFDAEQGIYHDGSELPVKVSDIALMRNLRNTHQIHQRVINYYSGDARPDSSDIDGLEPEIILVPRGKRLRSIERVFNRLFNEEGIPPEDAVVLTFAGKNNSELQEGDKLGKYTLTWRTGKRSSNQVQVATVQSFKGLERAIVLLVAEIDHIPQHLHDKLIYVGMSRAKQHLVVVGELPEPQGNFTNSGGSSRTRMRQPISVGAESGKNHGVAANDISEAPEMATGRTTARKPNAPPLSFTETEPTIPDQAGLPGEPAQATTDDVFREDSYPQSASTSPPFSGTGRPERLADEARTDRRPDFEHEDIIVSLVRTIKSWFR